MGVLMDRIVPRALMAADPQREIRKSLKGIATQCCWTSGRWDGLGLEWNDIQNVPRHVKLLSEQLLRLDLTAAQERRS